MSAHKIKINASIAQPSKKKRFPWEAIGLGIVLISLWEIAPTVFNLPNYILPRFSSVAGALLDSRAWPLYLKNGRITLSEALLGLAIGAFLGFIVGILLHKSPLLNRTTYPYIVAFQSVPKVALAPLFVIWLGFGMSSKVLVVVLLVFFPILVNTMSGLRATTNDYKEMFQANNATEWQTLRKLLLPNAMPSIMAGFELAVVVSLLGAIVAEFVGAQAGLGVMLLQAQYQLNTTGVFAVLVILGAIGAVFN
jgi:NitT/TauT family transport system permease protein